MLGRIGGYPFDLEKRGGSWLGCQRPWLVHRMTMTDGLHPRTGSAL